MMHVVLNKDIFASSVKYRIQSKMKEKRKKEKEKENVLNFF